MQLLILLGIAIAILGVTFALQNSVPVTVVFLLWRFDGSLAMIMMVAIMIGAAIVALLSSPTALKSRWELNRSRKEIANLQEANAKLRQRVAELEGLQAAGEPLAVPPGNDESQEPNAIGLKAIATQLGSRSKGSARG